MSNLHVPKRFVRGKHPDDVRSLQSAVGLLAELAGIVGRPDLSDVDLLDVGCGVKFTQAILNEGVPIGSYFGVDVYGEMVAFLQAEVHDERFTYHHMDVRNDRYNPDAPPMTVDSDLGTGERTFDVISLFSVFTHLAPHDYVAMLHLLRSRVRPGGTLAYSVFIDELTSDGKGLSDFYAATLEEQHSGASDGVDPALKAALRPDIPFQDLDPTRPLKNAMYSRAHALELVDGTGWAVHEVRDPDDHRQHLIICTPA